MVNRCWILPTAAAVVASILLPVEAFLPPVPAARAPFAAAPSSSRRGVVQMISPADLQSSLLNRFRSKPSATPERPNVGSPRNNKDEEEKAKKQAAAASSSTRGSSIAGSTKGSDDAGSLMVGLGQKLSRFTAAVLEEEGEDESARGLKTIKGIPDTFLKGSIPADEENIRGASAVVGALAGFVLGGPLLALIGASWTSYSCTVAQSDAGEAARGTGKWALELHNFVAKINRKKSFVQNLSSSLGGLYRRFKKEVAPEASLLDTAEASLQSTLDFTGRISKDFDLPGVVGNALVKTGEVSVVAVKALLEYNEQNKVTDKFWAWVRKEVLKEER